MAMDTPDGAERSALDLRVAPVVVFALAAAAMAALDRLFPHAPPAEDVRRYAMMVIGMAAALGISAVLGFRGARTTIHPTHPERSSTLVTGGVFGLSRNPMYLALALLLVAWAIHLWNWAPLIALPAFIAYITRYQIIPEERALRATFGDDYLHYAARVPRWLGLKSRKE